MTDARDSLAYTIRRLGFKQSVIAPKAGLTEQKLSDIVNKRRRLDANEMLSLCRAMGICPNDLFVADDGSEWRTSSGRKNAVQSSA